LHNEKEVAPISRVRTFSPVFTSLISGHRQSWRHGIQI